jgi:hypothetical protein
LGLYFNRSFGRKKVINCIEGGIVREQEQRGIEKGRE